MQASEISWDPESGTLTQSGIRYVLMRPDVVMGTAAYLPNPEDFVEAIAESAFANAQGSFAHYRDSGALDGADPLKHGCEMAGRLGWGSWDIARKDGSKYTVCVKNSPFALAPEGSDQAMCGWIAGVLRALVATHGNSGAVVTETRCAAQGHDHCEFSIEAD